MKILVTGGAGFIGAHLCRELLARPEVEGITVLDDFSTGNIDNIESLPVEVVKDTILRRDIVTELVEQSDAVVHLAAQPSVPLSITDPMTSHEVNVNGTVGILEACRKSQKAFVFASSSAVYGQTQKLPISEDDAAAPASPYAANKLAAESYALAYASTYKFPVAAFRFFNVYGPLQSPDHAYAAVIPSFIDAALQGRPLVIYGDGTQTRDFTYVGALVAVLADAALRRVASPSPVNLAFGTRTTIIDLAKKIELITERPIDFQFTRVRPGDVRDSQADNRRLRTLMPEARDSALEDGLRATIDWFNLGKTEFPVRGKV
ncbi:NAD-dependent epimerase/dehydratase family protein [Paractinoplanes lichenicola]|uniref:NAD-dependent epimerase/dehydratase family protein n=1 Tax=Paractinoplanes lichenicola TaxID=2802976 RepID=A0ABS1W6F1_9ACTN|nr:NAD-dependent epimerase/dehydratase family protein [Actinoplanes lichenicola]MBL7262310.1 NAD-dependent epimerase/dehydratase family protein [Actinoplanes lichenicola]